MFWANWPIKNTQQVPNSACYTENRACYFVLWGLLRYVWYAEQYDHLPPNLPPKPPTYVLKCCTTRWLWPELFGTVQNREMFWCKALKTPHFWPTIQLVTLSIEIFSIRWKSSSTKRHWKPAPWNSALPAFWKADANIRSFSCKASFHGARLFLPFAWFTWVSK